MPGYLPLCAFRQELMPDPCRSCAWWQTTGSRRCSPEVTAGKRREWMAALERSWGSTGLLVDDQSGGARSSAPSTPVIVASIGFAPTAAVPRLRELPFGPFPPGSALLFCLMETEGQARIQPKRLIQKALGQLKGRGVDEVYALAGSSSGGIPDGERCGVLPFDLLSANGFKEVMDDRQLVLMRMDLRGLISLLGQVEAAVRCVLRNDPTPSPAAWTRRGTP